MFTNCIHDAINSLRFRIVCRKFIIKKEQYRLKHCLIHRKIEVLRFSFLFFFFLSQFHKNLWTICKSHYFSSFFMRPVLWLHIFWRFVMFFFFLLRGRQRYWFYVPINAKYNFKKFRPKDIRQNQHLFNVIVLWLPHKSF